MVGGPLYPVKIDIDRVVYYSPGRFLAVSEIKMIITEILLNYEIKFEDEGKIPPFFYFGAATVPNITAEIMYRARKA